MTKLTADEIRGLDPYKFMAVIGKRVIHPGGRASTTSLLTQAGIRSESRVLDVGCGVATTAIEIARRRGAHVTAVDVAPLMLERAKENAQAAKLTHLVTVERDDILDLHFADNAFDVVIAETDIVTETGPFEMMTPRGFLADEGLLRCLRIMGRTLGRPAHVRKMAWLMPRMARAVPYLGYIVVVGTKPSMSASHSSRSEDATRQHAAAAEATP